MQDKRGKGSNSIRTEDLREILMQSAIDAVEEVGSENPQPMSIDEPQRVEGLLMRFGVPQDAVNLLAALREEGDEALVNHLKSDDPDRGVANLFIIPLLKSGELADEKNLIAATESPIPIVALTALTALIENHSKQLPKQLARFLGQPDVPQADILTALDMVETSNCNNEFRVHRALLQLHKSPDGTVADRARELTPQLPARLLEQFKKHTNSPNKQDT